MLPATAWDDPGARAWSVMGRLEDRQKFRIREAREARRRINARANEFGPIYRCMTVASAQQEYRDAISARWRGGPSVLAFLFAQPDSDAMRMLDARGEYFDIRSGDTWDLFFPGYYRSPKSREFEINAGGAGSVKTLPKIGISVLGISMGCAVMWNMRPKGDGYIPVERI